MRRVLAAMRLAWVLGAMGQLSACVSHAPMPAQDSTVTIRLQNAGAGAMQCQVMFGHWVDRDLGILAPGDGVSIAVQQQRRDGALYIMRDDGQRRMMIQTIVCGRNGDWQATANQLDLEGIRTARPVEAVASCALPAAGHVHCSQPVLKLAKP
jgi:hypothetical protein